MKRTASVICVAMLSVALAACGGAQDSSTAAKEESSPTATEEVTTEEKDAKAEKAEKAEGADESGKAKEAADPTEKFLGDWKLAAMDMGGAVAVGDMGAMFDAASPESSSIGSFKVSEDGTAVFGNSSDSDEAPTTYTWELVGDDGLKLVQEPSADDEDATERVLTGTYKDGELTIEAPDSGNEGVMGSLLFSRDGTTRAYEPYDFTKATNITDAKDLVGTWNMSGACMNGVTFYGDFAEVIQTDMFGTCEFREDGTATVMGEDSWTWKVGDDGVTLAMEGLDLPGKVLAYDDEIVVDLSEMASLMGGQSMQLVYAK